MEKVMQHTLKIILILLVLLTAACGSGGEDGGDNNPNQEAPYFNSIGTPTAMAGNALNFTVVANDPNSMNITLTYDGTLGPNANPFTAGASFDPVSGNFTWNTDSGDVGSYSVRFTATNDDVPPLETSVNVTILVTAQVGAGESLYNQHCASCHGSEGAGGSATSVRCSSVPSISEALGLADPSLAVGAMSGISLNTDQIQDISNYLMLFCN
jgi:mono/diheme cytochrome c family protein